jgi:hypothetical protein
MKPLVLFSGLAIACAVGLLALSYQGWRDDPSVVSSLEQGGAAVPARLKPPAGNLLRPLSRQPAREQQTAAVAPDAGSAGRNAASPRACSVSNRNRNRHCRHIANLRYRSHRTRRICRHGRACSSWQHCDSPAGRQGNRQRRDQRARRMGYRSRQHHRAWRSFDHVEPNLGRRRTVRFRPVGRLDGAGHRRRPTPDRVERGLQAITRSAKATSTCKG